jgi:hypothetical protein
LARQHWLVNVNPQGGVALMAGENDSLAMVVEAAIARL